MGQGLLTVEASRSHSDTSHSVGLLLTSDQPDAENSDNTRHSQETNVHVPGGIQTGNPSNRAATAIGHISLCSQSAIFHYVHNRPYFIMFTVGHISLFSQSAIFHYVHNRPYFIMFTIGHISLCSQLAIFHYVHNRPYFIMFTIDHISVWKK